MIYDVFGGLSPGLWYFVLNIPLFIAGWIFLSRRFFFYSLFGRGACTGRHKKVLLTVVNNYQLKRLEEAVFTIDADAFLSLKTPLM